MKVGLISDIHGNLQALEAVLKRLERMKVSAIWNLGDSTGYGANPEEVVQLLKNRGVVSILGNYDRKVLQFGQSGLEQPKKSIKRLAFRYALRSLSLASRAYLGSLPHSLRLKIDGVQVLLVHGSPDSDEEHLTAETPSEHLMRLARPLGVDLIACGHSHRAFLRRVGRTWFVNPGSVGRPDDGDPRASFAVLDFTGGKVRARLLRLSYDVPGAVAALRQAGLPEAFGEMLRSGRALDDVLRRQSSPAATEIPEKALRRLRPAVLDVIRQLPLDIAHAEQVTALSLRLFDQLRRFTPLARSDRMLLFAAAMLHDIGWVRGDRGHHKHTLQMILDLKELPLPAELRAVVANAARYHRRALPSLKHRHFAALDPAQRERVSWLGAIVRLADGLDCTHRQRLRDVRIRAGKLAIRVDLCYRRPARLEALMGKEKGEWLRLLLRRNLDLRLVKAQSTMKTLFEVTERRN